MPIAWPASQDLPPPVRFRHVLLVGLLAISLGQSMPVPAHAAPHGDASSGPAGSSAKAGIDAGRTDSANSPEIVPDKSLSPIRLAGVGLQLLEPDPTTGDTEQGFGADIRRWADIFVFEYRTFLPLIALFVAIGAMALACVVRRRLPMVKGGFRAGASPARDRPLSNRGMHFHRMTVQRSAVAASRPRIKPGTAPPSLRR